MQIGERVADFQFTATNNSQGQLSDYLGKWVILYFYPKDSTPGCTTEGQHFRDAYADFQALNAVIFGLSRESLKSHETFKCKQAFPFELISDSDEALCQLFDVMKMKSMYGKQYLGIERSTFLIDPQGILKYEWRKVSVPGHVDDVKAVLKKLQDSA